MFEDFEVIHRYSRTQAIEDGVLVDASELAKEAGWRVPVALTREVWNKYVSVPEGVVGADPVGRLWDIVFISRLWIRRLQEVESEMLFKLDVRNDNREGAPPLVTLKAVCGPGDDGFLPVVTIMLPSES